MTHLTERQKTVLLVIIREYIEAAAPVGSKRLVERYHLDLSPATIRHEMAALTEMGYLRQPHTSAGRVPTEDGYRFFVSAMMDQAELPAGGSEHHSAPVLPGGPRHRAVDASRRLGPGAPVPCGLARDRAAG